MTKNSKRGIVQACGRSYRGSGYGRFLATLIALAVGLVGMVVTPHAAAQSSATSISLQGRLTGLADGAHDLTFRFYASASGGTPVATILLHAVPISNGIFSVPLPANPATFNGEDRWWTVAVAGTELTPRALVTAVPYAMVASTLPAQARTQGDLGIGVIHPASSGGTAGYGNFLRFYGGPALGNWNGENSDPIWIARHNGAADISGMRLNIGDGANFNDYFGIGTTYGGQNPDTWRSRFLVRMNGLVSVGHIDLQGEFRVYGPSVITGRTTTGSLRITGGSDLAEPFDITTQAADPKVEPGMVVVIDREKDGQLTPCTRPYDTAVAGVISGANGLQPGMLMSAEGDPLADGAHPVAMTGRVWCLADASYGPIRRGDRLTTSATFGHAMRVDEASAIAGVTIGKAMSELTEGRGMVLVLVNLQ